MTAGAARTTAAVDDGAALIDELVDGLSASHASLVAVSAPLVPIEHAAAAIDGFGCVLSTIEGDAVVALSMHAILPLDTSADDITSTLRALARRASPVAPFVTFALPFDPSRTEGIAAFGPSGFVIPRVAYVVRRERAYLIAVGDLGDADAIRADASRLVARLAEPVRVQTAEVDRVVDPDDVRFRTSVDDALSAISAGEVDKVVLARRVRTRLRGAARPESLLASLAVRSPSTHRFALVRRDASFVGATPERLVSCRDGRVVTEALAGTKRQGLSVELVASSKDRAEQRWVLDSIRSALTPFVESLRVDDEPKPRELRDLVHLATTFDGPLRAGCSALDVVRALHPTPAVGGVPRDRAVAIIRRTEPFDRGHYAAPFGWFDANGDADVVVALRCGTFSGDHAELFAGAGIVDGSDAALELDETDLKLRALLSVLDGDAE